MIASLHGTLAALAADHAVIEVGGIGYLVGASARTLGAIGQPGGQVTLHTEMLVAEDSIRLVGFGTADERDWFRLLTSVQGVGARVALAILSILAPGDLARAIGAKDTAAIAHASGVGPKLAQRIANELRDRAPALGPGGGVSTPGGPSPASGAAADALSALANLGFRAVEATAAVKAAEDELGQGAGLDALVRLALKKAAR